MKETTPLHEYKLLLEEYKRTLERNNQTLEKSRESLIKYKKTSMIYRVLLLILVITMVGSVFYFENEMGEKKKKYEKEKTVLTQKLNRLTHQHKSHIDSLENKYKEDTSFLREQIGRNNDAPKMKPLSDQIKDLLKKDEKAIQAVLQPLSVEEFKLLMPNCIYALKSKPNPVKKTELEDFKAIFDDFYSDSPNAALPSNRNGSNTTSHTEGANHPANTKRKVYKWL